MTPEFFYCFYPAQPYYRGKEKKISNLAGLVLSLFGKQLLLLFVSSRFFFFFLLLSFQYWELNPGMFYHWATFAVLLKFCILRQGLAMLLKIDLTLGFSYPASRVLGLQDCAVTLVIIGGIAKRRKRRTCSFASLVVKKRKKLISELASQTKKKKEQVRK